MKPSGPEDNFTGTFKLFSLYGLGLLEASLVAQAVKNPPAMWETWVRSLGWEDPLEKGRAAHSSILAWRIPKDRSTWRATVHGITKGQTRLSDEAQPSTAHEIYIASISTNLSLHF